MVGLNDSYLRPGTHIGFILHCFQERWRQARCYSGVESAAHVQDKTGGNGLNEVGKLLLPKSTDSNFQVVERSEAIMMFWPIIKEKYKGCHTYCGT